tara:strand:- start:8276 stop:8533 length:258 start_codon:yes stop_codon:yes gene_type:complete
MKSEKNLDSNWQPSACTICESPLDEENGDIIGDFGIIPVGFCVWCIPGLVDMVIQLQGFDDKHVLEERLNDLAEEEEYESKASAF